MDRLVPRADSRFVGDGRPGAEAPDLRCRRAGSALAAASYGVGPRTHSGGLPVARPTRRRGQAVRHKAAAAGGDPEAGRATDRGAGYRRRMERRLRSALDAGSQARAPHRRLLGAGEDGRAKAPAGVGSRRGCHRGFRREPVRTRTAEEERKTLGNRMATETGDTRRTSEQRNYLGLEGRRRVGRRLGEVGRGDPRRDPAQPDRHSRGVAATRNDGDRPQGRQADDLLPKPCRKSQDRMATSRAATQRE